MARSFGGVKKYRMGQKAGGDLARGLAYPGGKS
jgi:hypothetical protein